MRRGTLSAVFVVLSACGGQAVPVLRFEMLANADPFNAAWNAARNNPQGGLGYTFPLQSDDIEPGAEVRLSMGRPASNGLPLTTADDVIFPNGEYVLVSTQIQNDGSAEFPQLSVETGAWVGPPGGATSLPSSLLCGSTVIAARAYQKGDGALGGARFLAATWYMPVTEDCP